MSESMSERLLNHLRREADRGSRPRERNATIDRLVEACDAIASGKGREIIRDGLPEAEFHFRREPVLIKPPRIDEYVRARRQIEAHARRGKSKWTGPTASTLRKDKELLEYVRVREEEQLSSRHPKVARDLMLLLDNVEDLSLRTELRFALAHGRRAEEDLLRLKIGMRQLRPTIDVEAIIEGIGEGTLASSPPVVGGNALSGTEGHPFSDRVRASAASAMRKLLDPQSLSKVGLEYYERFGNIVERKTRAELLSGEDLEALKMIAGLSIQIPPGDDSRSHRPAELPTDVGIRKRK